MATVVNEKEAQEVKAETEVKEVKPVEYLKEVKDEFFKITWPSREQVVREFFSVILLVAVLTGIIFVIDKVFGLVTKFFTGKLY